MSSNCKAIPIYVHAQEHEQYPLLLEKLNAMFEQAGDAFNDPSVSFKVRAHASEQEALGYANAIAGDGVFKPLEEREFIGVPNIWLTIMDEQEPSKRTHVAIKEALHPQSVLRFLELTKDTEPRLAFDSLCRGIQSLEEVLTDAYLSQAYQDALKDLPRYPEKETVEIDAGRTAKIDAVETVLYSENRYEAVDHLHEMNGSYIADQEQYMIDSACTTWSQDERDEDEAVLQALGKSVDECAETIQELVRGRVYQESLFSLEPSGTFNVSIEPTMGSSTVDIEFDGVTSSSMNVVVNEDFCKMLDTLKVSPWAWVRHMSEACELGTPNLDLDVQLEMQEAQREGTDLKEHLIQACFFGTDDKSITDDKWATAEYLFDIALEVLKSKAAVLDARWLQDNGVDAQELAVITSSRVLDERFPQLAGWPRYESTLAHLHSGCAVDYEWSQPPHISSTQDALVSLKDLQSVLDNASYSGQFVLSAQMSYDDLQSLRDAFDSKPDAQVKIDGAYFHIHSYGNGAGDAEPMTAPLSITASELKSWKICNDAKLSYGIEATFGDFLADRSSVRIVDPDVELAKAQRRQLVLPEL